MATETGIVLDSSALLALLREEPGAAVVERALPRAVISSINLAEVLTVLIRRSGNPPQAEDILRSLQIPVIAWDEALVWQSRDLCPWAQLGHSPHGLSLGDRACLTLARSRGATALTAESLWPQLALPVRVELIRPPRP